MTLNLIAMSHKDNTQGPWMPSTLALKLQDTSWVVTYRTQKEQRHNRWIKDMMIGIEWVLLQKGNARMKIIKMET